MMPVDDDTLRKYMAKTDELDVTVRQLTHSLERTEEKQQDLRDIMVEIKQGQADMIGAFRESVANVHKRVDAIHDEKKLAEGRELGRQEQRAVMFKWISGIVALIAIVGYIGRSEANTKLEATSERRYAIIKEVQR